MKRNVKPAGYESDESGESDMEVATFSRRKQPETQQTCLLGYPKPGRAPKLSQRKNEYLLAKRKEKQLGPVPRPQDQDGNVDFFVHSVRKNLNLVEEKGELGSAISNELMEKIFKPVTVNKICARSPKWINKQEHVNELKNSLKDKHEVSLDLEFSDEHTFKGMTALVQLSTADEDVLIDTIPCFSEVKGLMEDLMMSTSVLKVLCGSANDFLNIKRDFGISPALVLDIELLHKRIHGLPAKSPNLGLKSLSKTYLGIEIVKGEANRDFRRRPLPDELQRYAQEDSYYTFAVYQEMKKLVLSKGNHHLIKKAVEDTETLIKSTKNQIEHRANQVPQGRDEFEGLIFKWRHEIAKLLDDNPNNILSENIVRQLAKTPPTNLEDLKKAIGHHARILENNMPNLLRVIIEKNDFFSKTQCHKCGTFSHSAAQCNQPNHRVNQKEYYRDHPDAKAHQNARRNRNKKANKRAAAAADKNN